MFEYVGEEEKEEEEEEKQKIGPLPGEETINLLLSKTKEGIDRNVFPIGESVVHE